MIIIRTEPHDGGGDFLGRTHMPERRFGVEIVDALNAHCCFGEAVTHVGYREAWRDDVNPDAIAVDLLGQRHGKGFLSGLADIVGGAAAGHVEGRHG